MEDLLKDYTKLLDHTDEHLSLETLSIYTNLKGQLSHNEIKFVKKHLNVCSACKEKLEEIIEEDIEIDPVNSKNTKIFRLPVFIKYAAAASVIITVGIAIFLSLRSTEGEVQITENKIIDNNKIEEIVKDSLQISESEEKLIEQKIKEELKVDNKELYAVNIVLENFIERNLRSDKMLELFSPKSNDLIGPPVKFEWRANNEYKSIELEIVNNKNVKVFKKKLKGNSFTFSGSLANGLYYWKIKAGGRVSDIGKFIVK